MTKLFEGARQNLAYVLKAVLLAIVFFALQFAYQFFLLTPGELGGAFVRSFALSGTTLIGIALIIGPLAQLFPKYNFVFHRRTFGVIGFTFAFFHVLAVYNFFFQWNIAAAYYDLNPFVNPIIFGAMAASIFFLLWITSTDWAIEKLSVKKWKTLHRLVYLAFVFSTLHFATINPEILVNPPGFLLIIVTLLAIILQLTAFIKTVQKKKNTIGAIIGSIILIFGLLLAWIAFFT